MGATGEGDGSKQRQPGDISQQGESAANPNNNDNSSTTIEDDKGIYGFDQDVVQAESAEAPFRKLRLVSYGVLALIAVVLGGVSVAGLAGVEDLKELGENLPNPLLDAAVLGLAFYLWVEEVKTKRSALRLIERRREEKSRVPNRTARRLKKGGSGSSSSSSNSSNSSGGGGSDRRRIANKKVSSKKEAGGGVSQTTPSTVNTNSDGESAAAAVGGGGGEKEAAPPAKDGLFEGMRKTLDAVNKQSYYQALALNKELEDKGVLPPLERKPQPPGVQPVVEAETEGLVETAPDQDVSVGTAAPTAVTSEGGGGGGGGEVAPRGGKNTPRKGKGGRKNKRSKR